MERKDMEQGSSLALAAALAMLGISVGVDVQNVIAASPTEMVPSVQNKEGGMIPGSLQSSPGSAQNKVPSVQNKIPSAQNKMSAAQQKLGSVQNKMPAVQHKVPVVPEPKPVDPVR